MSPDRPSDAGALDATAFIDRAPEPAFDRVTALARRLLDVPVALVSFVDRDRPFFVGQDGLGEPWASARETPLTHSFCQRVVVRKEPLLVEDARQDPLVQDNAAIRDLDVVGYLGVPVRGSKGAVLGSLCAITPEPRAWTPADLETLEELAAIVETEVALRTALREGAAAAAHAEEAEEALHRSRDRLGFVLAVAGLGEWELDLETGEASRSPLHDRIFGYPAPLPQWTYEMFLEHVLEEDRDRVDAAFQSAILSGAEWDFVCRIRRADGALRWIAARGRSWLSEHGDPRRMMGTVIDITERWETRDALRQSEGRFQRLADAAPALLWVTEADGRCTFLSQSWYAYTGQTEETGLGFGWIDAVHPDDQDAAREAFLDATAREVPFRIDYRLRRHDGVYRWAIDAAQPQFDEDGGFAGFVGSVFDIHDRKQAEARTALLAGTGLLIEQALDYEATLREIADLAVPAFADWCAIDVRRPDGRIEVVAITHEDPEKAAWGRELRRAYPPPPDAPTGVPQVIRTGEPEVYPVISDEVLAAAAQDEEHLRLMRSVGLRSALVVPMRAGGEVTGALTFVHADSGRQFEAADVETAEEVARRAGAALEMARLHRALQEREARYRTLFESIGVGFCVLDIVYDEAGAAVDYRFAETNPAFVAQSGLSGAQGRTVRELVPGFPPERVAVYAAVAETGEAARFVREVEETQRWYEVYATRIGGPESGAVAVFSTDITDRRAAEQAVHESETRFRLLAETATDVILTVDEAWDVRYVNDAVADVLGYAPHELVGEPLTTIVPGRLREGHEAGVARHLATGERRLDWARVEVPGRRKDGTEVPLALSFGEYEAGGHRYFTAIIRDVSAQREAEAALRESEERYRTLFESVDVGFCLIDIVYDAAGDAVDYRFVETNPAFVEQTGLVEAEGRMAYHLIPGLERHWVETYAAVAETGEPLRYVNESEAMGRWFDVYAVRVGGGGSRRVALLFTDITERMAAERALRLRDAHKALLLGLLTEQRSEADPAEILAEAAEALGRSLGAHRVGFFEVVDGDTIDFGQGPSWTDGTLEPLAGRFPVAGLGSGYLEHIRAGGMHGLADTRTDPLTADSAFEEIGVRSGVGAPILRGGTWVAGLYVHHAEPREWTEAEVEVIREVAEQTWNAVGRARAEAALRESEARFRGTFENAAVGIAHVDLDGTWLRVNDRMTGIVGYAREELLTRTFQDITHPDDLSADLRELKLLLGGEIPHYHLEKRYIHRDGHIVWINLTVAPEHNADGGVDYLIAVVEDISAKKAAESALRQSETRVRLATEAAGLGLFTWTPDGDQVRWENDRTYEIFGVDPAATPINAAQFIEEVVDPRDAGAFADAIGRTVETGAPFQFVGRFRRPDGERGWVHFTGRPVLRPDGSVRQLIGTVADVTADKEAEAALRALNEELEDRVVARTAEFERSNAELDQFAYVASHDLKAPLRAIDSLATWIAEDTAGVLPPESDRHLALLRGRVARMEGLLDSLLTYSRAGRQPATPEPVDTGALVREVVALVAPPDRMRVEAEGAFPEIETARAPLELVLRNLVSNAIKHHDRPDGRVTVSARVGGDWAEFTVADDGPGIAPEYQARVFGLFQTLRPRDEVEGSGMGLAIVKKTVEGRGGRVTLESDGRRGTTFRFTWPLRANPPA